VKARTLIFAAISIALLASSSTALINPASAYCTRLGYEERFVDTPQGVALYCILPDGTECEEWDFAEGKCGAEYSYCARKGYKYLATEDPEKCKMLGSECMVCIKADGTEVEATSSSRADTDIGPIQDLQDIHIEPATPTTQAAPTTTKAPGPECGDGVCTMGEDCPADCVTEVDGQDMTQMIVWGAVGLIVILIIVAAVKKGRS